MCNAQEVSRWIKKIHTRLQIAMSGILILPIKVEDSQSIIFLYLYIFYFILLNKHTV